MARIRLKSIVRRKSTSEEGYLYGPYLMVTDLSGKMAEVCRVCCGNLIEEEGWIDKTRIEVIPAKRLQISDSDMDILLKENPDFYYHSITKEWWRTCNESREILVLYDKSQRVVIYANCDFQKIVKKIIKFKAIKKTERDTVEQIPLIKVSLGSCIYRDDYGLENK